MIYENVAPPEVANNHLNQIKGMFDSSGEGVGLWNELDENDRLTLCHFAGLDESLASHSIKNFNRNELKSLRQGTKRLEKLATRFNSISPLDFR